MTGGAPRFIIADPGLTGPLGHHLSYSRSVAEAAARAGTPAVILAARGFSGTIPDIECHPVLGTAYQSAGGGGALRRALFGGLSHLPAPIAAAAADLMRAARRRLSARAPDGLAAELHAALGTLAAGPGDWLLLHSVSGANLASLAAGPDLHGVTLLVVLRRMPAEMEADDAAPEPLPALLARLAARFGARLRLFADTDLLAADFRRLSGLPVRTVPLPIVVPDLAPRAPGALPHIVFAGGARLEKGYDHLPEAIAPLAGRARFTIQSGPVGAGADPLVQRAHRALQARQGRDLILVEQALDALGYAALLAGADLLLLPYDGPTYGARSSGILAEALALGLPAVIPAGGWMEAVAGDGRAVTIVQGGGVRAVAAALSRAIDHLPEMTAKSRTMARKWRDEHNPDALFRSFVATG
ncbi:glycosyltransferase [Falsiroseomonas stagni]|uniref:Glycosyltransferase involved in cell wall bisynthesis n=1 Tax=Falsiroseomonas stagni DSM 19981 TaxID=1123062 RepID=A0A1I3XJE2_9PROT|nr:glycosyltransferase [Falsiroseomonas stagni]SFK19707.1 Glycosyltransferase involved in cell wall bisynthesis [Falsiroseomonas stagni DSM 19981]